MSVVNALLEKINVVNGRLAAAKSAEAAKVDFIKQEASRLFQGCQDDYVKLLTTLNSHTANGGCHSNVHIAMANAAFSTDNQQLARKIVERFLQTGPQWDQYYCQAKLLLGLIINYEARYTNGNESIKQRKLALKEVMVALEVATSAENIYRYKFLVYNATNVAWQILQPYIRAGRAAKYTEEMQKLSAALESVNDPDMLWRVMYLSATAICFDDAKQSKEASESVDKAIAHVEKLVAASVAVEDGITAELKKATKETEEIMGGIRKWEEYEESKHRKPKVDPDAPEGSIPEPLPPMDPPGGSASVGYARLQHNLQEAQAKKVALDDRLKRNNAVKFPQQELLTKLYMQRVHVNVNDAKRVSGVPQVMQSLRTKALVQLQCMASGCIGEKEHATTFAALAKELRGVAVTPLVAETLADVSRMAWQLNQRDAAVECMEVAERSAAMSVVLRVKLDTCKALQILSEIALANNSNDNGKADKDKDPNKQRLTQKQREGYFVSRRVEAVKQLERCVTMAVGKVGDRSLLQELCVVGWNACVPLLQPHLRSHAHRLLQLVADALEADAAAMPMLRMMAHFEVCKCEEQADFVQRAKEEGMKALAQDYGSVSDVGAPVVAAASGSSSSSSSSSGTTSDGNVDRNRFYDHIVQPVVEVLGHRTNVYGSPPDAEGQANLLLQQLKESKSKSFQASVLTKAAYVMFRELGYLDASTGQGLGQGSVSSLKSVVIPEVSLDDLESTLAQGASTGVSGVAAGTYSAVTMLDQRRRLVVASIGKAALALKNLPVLHTACKHLLSSFIGDPSDPFARSGLDMQIDALFWLAESITEALSREPITEDMEIAMIKAQEEQEQQGEPQGEAVDPRAMGLESPFATATMLRLKRLALLALSRGMKLAVTVKDEYGVQNAVVYFWNLHVHAFRGSGLYSQLLPETVEFLKSASDVLETFTNARGEKIALDERLKVSLAGALANVYLAQKQFPQAIEAASKACVGNAASSIGSVYARRRLCELVARAVVLQSTSPGGAAAGGGKGGGKGAPSAGEPPKFDHSLLNVFATLSQIDLFPGSDTSSTGGVGAVTREQVPALVDRAWQLMTTDVATYAKSVVATGLSRLTQEELDQLVEMQLEAWSRLARAKILLDDIHGAQNAAEQGLALVHASVDNQAATNTAANADVTSVGVTNAFDERKLSPKAWRWASVCERYFGMAIARIVKEEGQDPALQSELKLAAIRHFAVACRYGQRANREELIATAAVNVWNVCRTLIDVGAKDDTAVRTSLAALIRQVVQLLLGCASPAAKQNELINILKLQFYLALIEGMAQESRWDDALGLVMEAFENVPASLQKPLWKWRVVAMSKRGKSVLDGLQKLKEGSPSLQARVYGILARASSNPKQQVEAYAKALDLLQKSMERVDYTLETVQWMASAGAGRFAMIELLSSAADCVYELEDAQFAEESGIVAGDDLASETVSHKSLGSARSSRTGSRTGTGAMKRAPSNASSLTKRASKAGSIASSKRSSVGKASNNNASSQEDSELPPTANVKYLELGMRACIMMAMLETDVSVRLQRCLEALYFVHRSLQCWSAALQDQHRTTSHSKLPVDQRLATPIDSEAFLLSVPPAPELALPTDGVALYAWQPSELFLSCMREASSVDGSVSVPSAESFPTLPLTVHYAFWLAGCLDAHGFTRSAVLVLAWLRAVVSFSLYFPLPVATTGNASATKFSPADVVLAAVHVRVVKLLTQCGLVEETKRLPQVLSQSLSATTTTTGLTCAQVLTFMVSQATTGVKTSGANESEQPDDLGEPQNVFGCVSWTLVLNAVDSTGLMQSVASDLLDLGCHSLSQSVAVALRRECVVHRDRRGELQAVRILAELDRLAGKSGGATLASVLAMVGSEEGSLNWNKLGAVGDAQLLAAYAKLALAGYIAVGNDTEARTVAMNTFDVIDDALRWAIEQRSGDAPTTAGGVSVYSSQQSVAVTTQRSLIRPSASSMVRFSLTNNSNSNNNSAMTIDCSYENASALVSALTVVVDFQHAECLKCIESNRDPRVLVAALAERFSTVTARVQSVAGGASLLLADVLETRSSVISSLALMAKHVLRSKCLLDSDKDKDKVISGVLPFVADSLDDAIAAAIECASIRRGFLEQLPHDERVYVPYSNSSSAGNNEPVTAMSNRVARQTALVELTASYLHILRSLLNGEHNKHDSNNSSSSSSSSSNNRNDISVIVAVTNTPSDSDKNNDPSDNPVTRYLQDTQPVPAFESSDFACRDVVTAHHFACSAAQLLGGCPCPRLAPTAQLLVRLALCLRCMAAGAYQRAWSVTVTGSDIESEAFGAREDLAAQVTQLLSSVSSVTALPSPELATAASVLFEAYGQIEASQAALWLLQLQGRVASDWLSRLVQDAINPTSETACAMRRLRETEARLNPSEESQRQAAAEIALLNASLVAWKRCGTSGNPASILQLALPAATYVFCLQTSPDCDVVYACCGLTSAAGATSPPVSGGLVGTWIAAKMSLSEQQKRALQVLVHQQRVWREDTSKFVSLYGEGMPCGSEFEGEDFRYHDKTLRKAERALEERLRATLDDFDSLFTPLLGPQTAIGQFLSSEEGTASSSLLLLLDVGLQLLPWEGLPVFGAFGGRVTRDFSVHLLGHRYTALSPSSSSQPSANVPITVCASTTRTICDPFMEDEGFHQQGIDRQPMLEVYKNNLVGDGAGNVPGAAKWAQLGTSKATLSLQDWLSVAMEGTQAKPTTVLFYGPGRVSMYVGPTEVLGINFENTAAVVCCDMSHNDTSIRRQNSIDNVKPLAAVALEQPLLTAALFSLAGCGVFVSHQWSTTFAAQQRWLEGFWEGFAKNKQNVTVAAAAGSADNVANGAKVKKWIKLARVQFGLPNIIYNESL